jgi:hypothetical protein
MQGVEFRDFKVLGLGVLDYRVRDLRSRFRAQESRI